MADEDVEGTIFALLDARREGATICPSDAARALWGDGFRPHMDEVRAVAAALVDDGRLQVTQRGEVVDPRAARGPIRLRRP